VSIVLQRRLGYRRCHVIQYLAYATFGLPLLHVITTSAEVQAWGMIGIVVFGSAGAAGLLLVLLATTAVAARILPQEV